MVTYTQVLDTSEFRRYRRQTADAVRAEADIWRRAGVVPGAVIADIGCGPGLPLIEMAKMTAPNGRAIGVERGHDPRAKATTLVEEAGLGDRVTILAGDAKATGLEPHTFDVVSMRHVLLHNPAVDAIAIVDHLAGLLKPGGHLVLVETDRAAHRWETSPHPVVAEMQQLHIELLEANGCDLRIGPKLGQLVREAGLEVVERSARFDVVLPAGDGRRPYSWSARAAIVAAGLATEADVQRWDASLESLGLDMEPVSFIPMFVVSARRPVERP